MLRWRQLLHVHLLIQLVIERHRVAMIERRLVAVRIAVAAVGLWHLVVTRHVLQCLVEGLLTVRLLL